MPGSFVLAKAAVVLAAISSTRRRKVSRSGAAAELGAEALALAVVPRNKNMRLCWQREKARTGRE